MDKKQFLDSQQEKFLAIYYNFDKTKKILKTLKPEQYETILRSTKEGIQKGINDFLERENEECIYESDLKKFIWDYSTKRRVSEEITELKMDLSNIEINVYAFDVCETYRRKMQDYLNEYKRYFRIECEDQ